MFLVQMRLLSSVMLSVTSVNLDIICGIESYMIAAFVEHFEVYRYSARPCSDMAWKAEFEKLYTMANEGEDEKLVQLADKMVTLLKEHGQSTVIKLKNSCVGVHPDNRGGKLLSPSDVHSKGVAICKAGFAFT